MTTPLAVAAAALVIATAATGCSSSSGPTAGPAATSAVPGVTTTGAADTSAAVTRWWGNSGAAVGSRIDPTQLGAVAQRLHPSRADYCGMLRQTVAAKHSILPGATANDPALTTATTAFVAELQHVAPGAVSAAWQELGGAVLVLVRSGGKASALTGVDASKVRSAARTVAADAKARCGVNLSAVAH